MKNILIAGGSGLVGTHLSKMLSNAGYSVRWLSRSPEGQSYQSYHWDVENQTIDESAFDAVHVIINLAGAGIADKKWSSKRKKILIDSRTKSTALLNQYIQRLHLQPEIFINASATGFYGDRGSDWMNEDSKPGTGFLSKCCIEWEKAANAISGDFPKIILRIGVVLTPSGGALEKMLMPLKIKTNTYFGNGKQYMSWIHIEDLCRIFLHFIQNPTSGIFNAVTDGPLQNKKFVQEIADGIDTTAILLPAPTLALRLAMGEMADVVLESTRVSDDKIKSTGFEFKFTNVAEAVNDLIMI